MFIISFERYYSRGPNGRDEKRKYFKYLVGFGEVIHKRFEKELGDGTNDGMGDRKLDWPVAIQAKICPSCGQVAVLKELHRLNGSRPSYDHRIRGPEFRPTMLCGNCIDHIHLVMAQNRKLAIWFKALRKRVSGQRRRVMSL
jgi:hypothetical protein